MGWVVDTCVLLDICTADPLFSAPSAACLTRLQGDGLVVSPLTYVELAPAFRGDREPQDRFLASAAIAATGAWTQADTDVAHALWHSYAAKRRQSALPRRPIADVLIAAFASRWQGLITRNVTDFRQVAPALTLIDPTASL